MEGLQAKLTKVQHAISNTIPKRVAANAERHFKESFRKQGFTNANFLRWAPTKGGKAGRVLRKSGLLFNSIRIDQANENGIRIVAGGAHVPYAQIHNEGGTINRQATRRAHIRRGGPVKTRRGIIQRKAAAVRRHQVRMNVHIRKRQFMGPSITLDGIMKATIQKTIAEALK